KRMLFGNTVTRLCIAGAVNQCGIPLVPAARIIHADMMMQDFMMTEVDPFQMFFNGYDKKKQSYIRREGNPDPDGLYDPNRPVVPHKSDMFIEIVNSQYVSIGHFPTRRGSPGKKYSWVLGELTADRSDFIIWQGATFDHIIAGKKPRPTLIDDSGLWASPNKKPT